MRVKTLIEALAKLDPDAKVYIQHDDGTSYEVVEVDVDEDGDVFLCEEGDW